MSEDTHMSSNKRKLQELQKSALSGLGNISKRQNFGVSALPELTPESLKSVDVKQLHSDLTQVITQATHQFEGPNGPQLLADAIQNGHDDLTDLNALYDAVVKIRPQVEEFVQRKTAEDQDANRARARQKQIFNVLKNQSTLKLLAEKYKESVQVEEDEEKALLQKDISNMGKALNKEFETRDNQNSHAGLHAQLGKNLHILIERPMINLLSRAAGLGNIMPQTDFDDNDNKKGDGVKFMPMG